MNISMTIFIFLCRLLRRCRLPVVPIELIEFREFNVKRLKKFFGCEFNFIIDFYENNLRIETSEQKLSLDITGVQRVPSEMAEQCK